MWSKEKIWDWYNEKPWIVGFNYLPSTAVNSTAMWQKENFDVQLIDRELKVAAEIGFNTCRVFIQYLLWKDDKNALFKCFDQFLAVAAGHGIKVMPILFDDCAFSNKEPYLGKQDDPIPGIHNSGWTPSPGIKNADDEAEQEQLKHYVIDFVSRYKDDHRILLWDLYNEPGNNNRHEKCITLLQNVFAWARECEPEQPLTSGVFRDRRYSYLCAELSDIVSFHDYRNIEDTKMWVERLEGYGRPIICTEWLRRTNNNLVETHMAYYKEKRIGIVNWGLIAGKTQTYYDWNASKNPKEGKPEIWQHDLFNEDLTPYCEKEIELIKSLIECKEKIIHVQVQEMTPEIMDILEKKGMIIRLCPSHHRFDVPEGEGIGQDIYASSISAGAHKLLAVGINRSEFSAFGVHDENEEVLLLGSKDEKDLYMLFGLHPWEILSDKRDKGILCGDDFVCLHCKYNDPEVSFFVVCKGVLHGEATGGEGLPATFYVTESTGIKLDFLPWNGYKIQMV